MRTVVNRYETEIRLGLVIIVTLLLLLNITSTYAVHRVKQKLTTQVDRYLGLALQSTDSYLMQKNTRQIDNDEAELLERQFNVSMTKVVTLGPNDSVLAEALKNTISSIGRDGLSNREIECLLEGRRLFRSGDSYGSRFGLSLTRLNNGQEALLIVQSDSWVLDIITGASRMTLFLGIGVMVLIVPLTIGLPRLILRPFKTMREKARSAGRLGDHGEVDEVAEITQSYETIIDELRASEVELKRLYAETSSRADQLERFNRYILKSVGSGVINVDLSGKVVGYNHAARDVLGYHENEVVGKYYLMAFPGEMEFCTLIEAGLLRGESVSRREIAIDRGQDRKLWLGIESSLILDDNDRAIGVTLLFTDLTELKKLEVELEMSRRMAALGEMTAGLAHQLRNSLAAVSGFSQLLKKKAPVGSALSDIAESIRSETKTSATMVSRFLSFSKPLHLNEEVFDLIRLLSEAMNRFSNEAQAKNISLNFSYPEVACSFVGDALLLKEAIVNLLDNSMQAVGKDGRIDMTLEWVKDVFQIVVADTGPGIADNIRDKLFTPFFSSTPSGTGLGLALAQKIISLHKGSIFFDAGQNRGAVCRVTLPSYSSREISSFQSSPAIAKKA